MRLMRAAFGAAVAAAVLAGAASCSSAAVDCVARPSNAAGYEIRAINAADLVAPPTTPAIAVLDSGVASVPELQGRLRTGYNVINGSQNTNDIDGHGTAVASV